MVSSDLQRPVVSGPCFSVVVVVAERRSLPTISDPWVCYSTPVKFVNQKETVVLYRIRIVSSDSHWSRPYWEVLMALMTRWIKAPARLHIFICLPCEEMEFRVMPGLKSKMIIIAIQTTWCHHPGWGVCLGLEESWSCEGQQRVSKCMKTAKRLENKKREKALQQQNKTYYST